MIWHQAKSNDFAELFQSFDFFKEELIVPVAFKNDMLVEAPVVDMIKLVAFEFHGCCVVKRN